MELLNNCREYAHGYYSNLLVAAEKKLIDSLFEHSDAAKSNDEQRFYYEAMQLCRKNSGSMHDAFNQQLNDCYQRFSNGVVASQTPKEAVDELSLVNTQKLEDDLAISVIVSKSNSRYSEPLWKLNKRLSVLRSGTPVYDEDNPFAPSMVGEALQAAVNALGLESKARLLVYKQLGKLFIIGFEKPLKQLNEQLSAKGILPNLKFLAQQQADGGMPSPPVLAEPDHAHESPASIENQRKMFEAIQAIQAQLGPRTHTAGGVSLGGIATDGDGSAAAFGQMDYALALSAVQQSKEVLQAVTQNRPMPAEQVEKKVVEQLLKQGDEKSRHKMTGADANTVDLVGMIFRYILDDENLSDAVKSLLSHLHTPYLKLALMDKTFIDNYEHSARILINSLADVGGRWVKDEDDKTVLPKIRLVVETILKGFVDDYSIFDRLLEDFQRFRENLEKRSKMVEKRNTESQLGMERLELSRHRAEEEVLVRFESGEIDQQAAAILQKPWTDFLAFNLLRHGDEGSTWQSALKVVDAVVWSIQKKQAVDNKEDFHRRQHEFEASIKEGLLAMGYDPEASKGLLLSLHEAQELAYHQLVLDGSAAKAEPQKTNAASEVSAPKAEPVPESETQKSTEQEPPQTAIQRQQAKMALKAKLAPVAAREKEALSETEQQQLDALKDIAFGTWFDFVREDGGRDRMKLAWYSRVTSNYMFVNNAGVKQAVMTCVELAKGMQAGTIELVVLEKRSFMERAIGAVFNKLKSKAQVTA
ncbi:DUF1631 domain-containing protein [Dasania sp. GY-MA-18]|uniref:DUF1631 domain-containing protein n=1 Tax=Dasania phycosphaerae TaxID=2950436 RepID=A0A9J6RRC6_9GAMM|nr:MULTISPECIES: DUF1631 domain-containing protein [Dasania]MCR8924040.1 DUF1631 domain-containing protein [Dasania sp. GY-MA-18]MCZ0866613.1 DUF1631 domain-containing protein [Dasania phycosphaerae]MCZ0870198.1 DUF1631 domain-containing protein [Dasania phycosphaerae]